MKARNNVNDTASDVAQYKKVRVRVLGRGARSKSKRQSPPSASHTGSSTNVPATHLERRKGTAQSNCIQGNVAHHGQATTNCYLVTGMVLRLQGDKISN